ncbi:unnamed protein product [Ilex paraguariensis]|uniref:Uncharacterized protein n=1 Tax=Ilex paraguariensis TaxID=185542 RepID=A0ABC8QYY2_9AQUA
MAANCVIELEAEESPGTKNDSNCQADRTIGTRRKGSSPNVSALKILIDDDDKQKNALVLNIEATPREKGYKPMFWKPTCGDHPQAKEGMSSYSQLRGINCINQLFGWIRGSQRQLQIPLHLQFSCSVQFMLALMLMVFLLGKLLI